MLKMGWAAVERRMFWVSGSRSASTLQARGTRGTQPGARRVGGVEDREDAGQGGAAHHFLQYLYGFFTEL